jgi:hypothetical protein
VELAVSEVVVIEFDPTTIAELEDIAPVEQPAAL